MTNRPCYDMLASAVTCPVPGTRWTYVAALTSPSGERERADNRNARTTGRATSFCSQQGGRPEPIPHPKRGVRVCQPSMPASVQLSMPETLHCPEERVRLSLAGWSKLSPTCYGCVRPNQRQASET